MTQARTLGEDTVSQGLLAALRGDEDALKSANDDLTAAQSQYDIVSRRYAAMRVAVRQRLGVSPYSERVKWPRPELPQHYPGRGFGQFRFVHMKVGEAVVEALQESKKPLNLDQLVDVLSEGGLYVRDMRTVNAALINTPGVKKVEEEGDNWYEMPEPEDLPS